MIVFAVLVTWMVGSLPLSKLVERLWNVQLRNVGTGNVGAGNATRSLGIGAGVTLAVLDGLKGLIPVVFGRWAGFTDPWLVAIGLASVVGNNWPVWRGERGGRGLAASVGVIVGFAPLLVVWPTAWAAIGWQIGGGLAGFIGWTLLSAWAFWSGLGDAAIALGAGLGLAMGIRRLQGNAGFAREGAWRRLVFDRDPRPVVDPVRPLAMGGGMLLWVPGLLLVGFPFYLWVAGSRATDVHLAVPAVLLLTAAASLEFAAKYAFGALFRQGAVAAGLPISRWSAFRAALIGSGIARIIPAGGVVTPFAMSWAVDRVGGRAVGAAMRATVLSYGGLVIATGLGLGWVSIAHPPGQGGRTAGMLGLVGLILGGVLISGGSRLRRLIGFVPSRFRGGLDRALVDHRLDRRAWFLLSLRTVLEAATLGLTLMAFDVQMAPSQVVAAFGVAHLVGGLPGTPGGLGFTEAGLLGSLVLFGVPAAAAATPIMIFRVISYWLPALGGLALGGHAFLRRTPAAGTDHSPG